MNKNITIKKTAAYVEKEFSKDTTGHDWWHIFRVWKLAKRIALAEEEGDVFIIEMAALLHDLDDYKLRTDGKTEPIKTKAWLESLKLDADTINEICFIVENISFKGVGENSAAGNVNGQIVQDADRLDAIGAIGLARVFTYGGSHNRNIFDPAIKAIKHKDFAEYRKKGSETSIDHFYEKLLLLKNLMNTETAKKIASDRHLMLESFLKQFFAEWEGADYTYVYPWGENAK